MMLKKKNIKTSVLFLMFGLFLFACKNHNNSNIKVEKQIQLSKINEIPKDYIGNYSVFAETEATTTGMASITYNFTINKNEAILETNTYHEPIRCNGKYKIVNKNNFIELYYNDQEASCRSEYPDFEIKKYNGKYFIKGVGNEVSSINWQELKKE